MRQGSGRMDVQGHEGTWLSDFYGVGWRAHEQIEQLIVEELLADSGRKNGRHASL